MDEKKYTGYCIKCRCRKDLLDTTPHKMRNPKSKNDHVEMIKGRCADCNGIVYVVIGHG